MDEGNGLHFMRARYYDEANGRFLQEDPVYNQNLYLYAENNPMMGIDPNGLYANSTQPIINDDNSSYPWWYNATNWGWDDDPKTLKTIETVGLGLSLGLAVAPAIAALPVVGASAATLSTLGGGAAIATGINEIPTVAKMFSGELTSKDAIIESVTLAGSALGDIKTKNIKGTKGIVTAIGKSIGKAIDLADKLKSGLKIITNTASIVKRKK